jgi:hypothetical protein
MWDSIIMGNGLLLLFSLLIIIFTIIYFKRKWPDLDVIDFYIIFIALHYGVYPFIRGLYFGKGQIYDTYNANLLVISLIFLQVSLTILIIKVIWAYLPMGMKKYLKVNTLITQWARVDKIVLLSIYCLLLLFQFICYYKYGVKSHIVPEDFANLEKALPYWLTSIRTIYNLLVLCVFIVLVSKAAMAEDRYRYCWMALIILFIPFVAYFGRKAFVNAVEIGRAHV